MSEIWNEIVANWRADGMSEEGIDAEAEKRTTDPVAYDCALAIDELDRPDILKVSLTEGGLKPDAVSPRTGKPLLFLAIVKGRIRAVRILLEAGADPAYLSMGKDYLFWAVFCDTAPAVVEEMLVACDRVSIVPTSKTLEVARRKARSETVRLLERWVDGNRARQFLGVTDRDPTTALAAGDSVRVTSGKYINARAVIESAIDGTSRFWLQVSLFGRNLRVEVEASDLERQ